MTELLDVLLKISLVVFMAGNLLDMGLRLDPRDALRGLRDIRFVANTLLYGFVVGPALSFAITRAVPLERPYAMGLILIGMTPCAPFLPMIVKKAKGDLGYAAALMLLTALGTVMFMPIALPLMAKGLSVTSWTIAKPLLVVIFLPLVVGMSTFHASPGVAAKARPLVRKLTGMATIAMGVLSVIVYGKGLLGVLGSLALLAQIIFFSVLTFVPYVLGFGLRHEQRVVLSAGMATRNLGAALAPLLTVADTDQRAIIMVVLGLPVMVLFALLAVRWFGRRDATDE